MESNERTTWTQAIAQVLVAAAMLGAGVLVALLVMMIVNVVVGAVL